MITPHTQQLIDLALSEDLIGGDATTDSIFSFEDLSSGELLAKVDLVLCGTQIFDAVMRQVDPEVKVEWAFNDGDDVADRDVMAKLSGRSASILKGERTALNFLQRLSGIATQSRLYAAQLEGFDTVIVDTRKTLPGWRSLDKMAVVCGGALNHRFNLSSGVMIKDNHIAAAGSIAEAVERVRKRAPHTLRIEVEVTRMEELEQAVEAGADIIMLDNMSTPQIKACVDRARALSGARPVILEASGGITLERLPELGETGVDVISSGALTHSVIAADISLNLYGRDA